MKVNARDRAKEHRPFHVHFETSPKARPSQYMSSDRVQAILAEIPDAAEGLNLTFNDDVARTDAYFATAEVIMVAGPVDLSDLKRRAPMLKWLQLSSAGVETAVQKIPPGVTLTNVRGVHSARAAEFGITCLLMLNNRIPAFTTLQKERLCSRRLPIRSPGRRFPCSGSARSADPARNGLRHDGHRRDPDQEAA